MIPRLVIIIGLLLKDYLAHSQATSSVSTLTLRRHVAVIQFFSKRTSESGVLYSQIRRMMLHRRGHAAKGFFIGAGVGALVGFIAGDDPPGFLAFSAADKAVFFSVPVSLVGLIIGAAVTQSVNAKEQSVAAEVPARFRKFTIVEQVKQAHLYTP